MKEKEEAAMEEEEGMEEQRLSWQNPCFVQEAGGTGSKAKAEWMAEATENWFYENKDIQPSEVALFLDDIIIAEFNCDLQDGSLEQVGEKVCSYWRICSTEDEESIQKKLQR